VASFFTSLAFFFLHYRIADARRQPQWVANAEMLSVTATRRLVRSRAGRSRGDCRKSGMWRVAASDKMNTGHAEFGGPGHIQTSWRSGRIGSKRVAVNGTRPCPICF
jgi:hypothetical protein